MNKFISFAIFITCVVSVLSQTTSDRTTGQRTYGAAFDEIVVESSLNVRKKPEPARRRTREIIPFAPQGRLYRTKRQFQNFGDFGSSSALANAASHGQYSGPDGFGGSAGIAQGQAFNSQGPLGSFGAAAAGSQTQGFHAGPDGIRGSAGLSGSQTYNLPGGHSISLSYSGDYAVGPDGRPTSSQGNSIAYTK